MKVAVNGAVEVAKAGLSGDTVLTMNDGLSLTAGKLTGEDGTFVINTADAGVLTLGENANPTAKAVLAAAQNDQYATALEAKAALENSVGSASNLLLSAEEDAVADAWAVSLDADGNETLGVYSWRHEFNNLQKCMCDIRDLKGDAGAWARATAPSRSTARPDR